MNTGTFIVYNVLLILVETAMFHVYNYFLIKKRLGLRCYEDLTGS